MNKIYKVVYATGSRADYGIVRRYLQKLNQDKNIDFSVLVTGSHLDENYGKSIENIKADGFHIAFEANIKINNKNNAGILHSMSLALDQFGDYFEKHKFDLLIILGDRYEMLSVAIAAAMQKIPILHLHGGEVTYGNYDEFIRHCITKMSNYHFTSTGTYRNRVVQLGENPEYVYYMGALGAENCTNIDECVVAEWIKKLEYKKYFVVAFHPETLTNVNLVQQVEYILRAVSKFQEEYMFIFIGSNADTGSNVIKNTWSQYTQTHHNVIYIENINVDSYLYMVKNSIALIGNSSSGIIEAPSLGVYTINIGKRQEGRVRGNSVIDINCEQTEIENAIQKIIDSNVETKDIYNPYYLKDTAENYFKTTKAILENLNVEPKKFYDIIKDNISISYKQVNMK